MVINMSSLLKAVIATKSQIKEDQAKRVLFISLCPFIGNTFNKWIFLVLGFCVHKKAEIWVYDSFFSTL